jgi:hypothetical protein
MIIYHHQFRIKVEQRFRKKTVVKTNRFSLEPTVKMIFTTSSLDGSTVKTIVVTTCALSLAINLTCDVLLGSY